MNLKRALLISLPIVLLGIFAFIPKQADPIERLVSSLQTWVDTNPQEKVYLHMDKPYYALGDTVWFKAYVTIGSRHQLSKMSGALYVELINDKDSLLSSVKLPLIAGMAKGNMALGDTYKEGNFRIRAYTQWMRNAGEEYFFDKTFVVGDPISLMDDGAVKNGKEGAVTIANRKNKDVIQPVSLANSDVQFFPEGGTILNEITSRIGFKVTRTDGRSLKVTGMVLDNENNEVSSFETLHAGMGAFSLRPETGKQYQAKLTFTDGTVKEVELPKAVGQGYSLAVYQPNQDSILVRINASAGQYQTPQSLNLVVQTGGEVQFASTVKISKAINSVWLEKKDFPTGIAQFTLFGADGEPLNERIAFIRSDDKMELKINTAKTTYKSREKVEIELQAKDKSGKAVAGNFSVSVIDESKVPSDENNESTILSSLLLSADIKGYIEQPNYYFSKETEEVNRALDNLMLTQGYRRFTWKAVLNGEPAKPFYKAESLGTELSGKVLTLTGQPVANGTVTVMSLTPGFMEQAKTDAEGKFKYDPIMLTDSLRFAVQARNAKGKNKVEVILDTVPKQVIGKNWNSPNFIYNIAESTKQYLENSVKQDELLSRTGGLSRVNRLKEVNIRATKVKNAEMSAQGSFRIPEGHADHTYIMKDGDHCASLGICLQGLLGGVVFMPYPEIKPEVMGYPIYRKMPMRVFLDGRRIDNLQEIAQIFDQNSIDPKDIVKIDVVTNNQALIALADGTALFIYTRKTRTPRYNPSMANIKPKGFNNLREFYAPRYDRPGLNSQLPDLRSTIYWNAGIKTYQTGRTSFSFFNADGPGTYKVIVEGINAEGELGREVYRYEVEHSATATTAELPSVKTQPLVNAMQALQRNKPAEKVYLHMDKPYYNLGDTIWFKAYLFDAANLAASKRSGLLYIELNDDTAEVVRRISIPVKNGIGYAQIPLPKKIFHEGGYTLRAYTNWMQNFGEAAFFTKRLYLGLPAQDNWLVKSNAKINRIEEKAELEADFILNRPDLSLAALREVEIRVMEGDKLLNKQKLQTGIDGKLQVNYPLSEKADVRNIRAEIRTLHQNDGNQRLIVPLNINRDQNIDLQFLPEGGNLVAGLKTLIGFKAIGEDGKGRNVSGDLYDHQGSVVASFSSLYNGMGSLDLTPELGETYTARLKLPAETGKVYALPVVQSEGMVVRVINKQESDSLFVQVEASASAINPDSTYFLTATSRGIVTYAQPLDLKTITTAIPKKRFPTGITRFILLRNHTSLSERRVFIDHHDQLKVAVSTNKAEYYKRDSVAVNLEVKDKDGNPVEGNFSLAVTDDSQVKSDTAGNNSIIANMLLSSELKGVIENPAYYLNGDGKERWQAMDNLMLTQGWVGYDWKDAFSPVKSALFAAEKYFKVSGTVENLVNKPIPGAQMLISSQKPFFINTTITDDQGKYVFENLPQIDSGSFFIQAKSPKGKTMNFGEVTVDRFKAPAASETFRDQLLPWYVNTDVAQLNYVKYAGIKSDERSLKQTGISLKEVKITDKKIIKGSYNRAGAGNADLVFDEKDIKESGVMNLYQLLKQKLPGLRVTMEEGLPTLRLGKYMVVIEIDGGGLPLRMKSGPTVDELIEELSGFKIDGFLGMEVLYSRKYTGNYTKHPDGSNKGNDILAAQLSLQLGSESLLSVEALPVMDKDYNTTPLYEVQPYFRTNYKERTGYLELRANVLTNITREIAVIGITTKTDRGWYRLEKPGIANYRPLPVMHPKEFYSPKYTVKTKDNAEQDLRATIYWKPDIITDASGKATVYFYTADLTGKYTLNLQGSDMDGNIGSSGYQLKVVDQAQ